jgi:hypothetical protein
MYRNIQVSFGPSLTLLVLGQGICQSGHAKTNSAHIPSMQLYTPIIHDTIQRFYPGGGIELFFHLEQVKVR